MFNTDQMDEGFDPGLLQFSAEQKQQKSPQQLWGRDVADISNPGNGAWAVYLFKSGLRIFHQWYQQFSCWLLGTRVFQIF